MPKYLVQASYTAEGTRGLLKDGGTKRRAVVDGLMKGLGGTLESFYYAFGDADVYAIINGPDNVTAAAVSMAINAGGAVTLKTTPLLSPEEIDEATNKTVSYQPPGQ